MTEERSARMPWNRHRAALILLAFIGVAGLAAWWQWGHSVPLAEGLIQANGRIEGDRTLAASKLSGRVVELRAQEGTEVVAGEIMAQLDDAQIRARVDQALAAVETQEARARAANTLLGVLERDIPLKIQIARAEVAHAEAQLSLSEANERQAGKDAARLAALYAQGSLDAQRSEKAALAWKVAAADLTSARTALSRAVNELKDAELGPQRIEVQRDEIQALEAQLAQARAVLDGARSTLQDLQIPAPASGVVTTRIADLGQVVRAGAPLYEIVDLDRLYLEVYVPEKEIGKLRLDLPARIYTDAFPDTPFPARVRYIASRAEFTPKEVQTPDERVKLVYAVKLYLDENPDHRLAPGLPADAIIRWIEDVPWMKPRW